MTRIIRAARRGERGAALILTVVIIMVLTTLALTMAAFTVTEERTATTYRDSLQTRAIAEAGARAVQQMFFTPDDNALVPLYSSTATADDPDTNTAPNWDYWGANDAEIETNLNKLGIWRKDRAGTSPTKYSGNDNRFFHSPFKESWARVFGGTYSTTESENSYDLRFTCTDPTTGAKIANADTKCWLETKINKMLSTSNDFSLNTGKITDISFYAPPAVAGRAYGLATIRVTAVKYDDTGDTNVIARETIEAVIIDVKPKPAVLGNGDIVFVMQAGKMCGNGCEQIHANGTAEVGDISGGTDPMVTATEDVVGGSGSIKEDASEVSTPEINPWDLNYKPTVTAELNKYYLAAARPLDAVWTDGVATGNPAPRKCGPGLYSECQDYNLEYTTAGVDRPRAAANTPSLYKWDDVGQGWTLCSSGTTLNSGGVAACAGAPEFSVQRFADDTIGNGGTGDLNDLPYAKHRIPRTVFEITAKQDNATVLVDGIFWKHGSLDATMTIVAVGSLKFHSSSTWYPAMSNRTMWVSGRDIDTQSNCCVSSNTCSTNLVSAGNASIIAAHEQIKNDSQTTLLGLIVGENRVNYDSTVNSSLALDLVKGDHGSRCDDPEWPWVMPVVPAIASMKTAAN
jgi:hypothetical protein